MFFRSFYKVAGYVLVYSPFPLLLLWGVEVESFGVRLNDWTLLLLLP